MITENGVKSQMLKCAKTAHVTKQLPRLSLFRLEPTFMNGLMECSFVNIPSHTLRVFFFRKNFENKNHYFILIHFLAYFNNSESGIW